MRNKTREERLSENYRKVEAMEHRGLTSDEIAHNLGITKMDVLDISQAIFARKMRQEERRARY